jgi:tRNA-specific 2-thiouridylase
MRETPNSLGLPKPPEKTRVVAAMSGGVDSSVVAALLAREGYEVVGVTLQLYDHGRALRKNSACCAGTRAAWPGNSGSRITCSITKNASGAR